MFRSEKGIKMSKKQYRSSEMEGAALDWAVAKAAGRDDPIFRFGDEPDEFYISGPERMGPYSPATSWAIGGQIIEREKIGIGHAWEGSDWLASAHCPTADVYRGKTALIAAMRCYVASKLGDEVEIPEEIT